MDWKKVGKQLTKVGLPILGGALGGPAGAKLGAVVSSLIGVENTPDAVSQAIEKGNLTGEQLAMLQKYQMDHKENLEKLRQASEERDLQNIVSARDMYKVQNRTADIIANKIINENLWMIIILVIINALAIVFMPAALQTAVGVISNLIGIVIGKLLTERQAVINFFFGSSFGSKVKDATIAQQNER